ncbi:TNT domain-containing protein [Actinomadura coerulea]|uniref:TNT domain-containing protein n=1 Tax=Actinomadura coerulea TaxID=46159 RepID=UPI0034399CE2
MTGQDDRVAELEGRVVDLARRLAPPGWRRLDLHCAATVADRVVALAVLTGDGRMDMSGDVPDELAGLLMDLRRVQYRPERGTWFSMVMIIEPGSVRPLYNREFDPLWDPPLPAESWRRDQIVMPRDGGDMPGWLRDRMDGREPAAPPAPDPGPMDPAEQAELLSDRFPALIASHAPVLWERISGHYQAAGGRAGMSALTCRQATGAQPSWTAPAAAAALLDRLRAGTRAFHGSTWSRIDFEVVYEDGAVRCRASFTHDDEPRPRPAAATDTPPLPRPGLRRARIFDHAGPDGTRPAVSRPPVPPEEAGRVAEYLRRAPTVMAARSNAPDRLDPSRGAAVPLTFHTDGTWVWSSAVAYYLSEHGVPPEPDLVAHIRAGGFRVPDVDDDTMNAANAAVTGHAAPERVPEEPDWAGTLQHRLDQLRVDRAAYRVNDVAEGVWCLTSRPGRWSVFQMRDGERRKEAVFDDPEQASAHLLGRLLLDPRHTAGDGPFAPLKGEPPLSLLRDRHVMELAAGTEVDRYGAPDGNVTYAARTPYPQRSLPPEWRGRPYRVYRLQRPMETLTGTAVPWFGQPGGGTAHVFGRSMADLVADGGLVEVTGG